MRSMVKMGDTNLASDDKSFLLLANFLEDDAKEAKEVDDGLPGPLEHDDDEDEKVASFCRHLRLLVMVVVNDVQETDGKDAEDAADTEEDVTVFG